MSSHSIDHEAHPDDGLCDFCRFREARVYARFHDDRDSTFRACFVCGCRAEGVGATVLQAAI